VWSISFVLDLYNTHRSDSVNLPPRLKTVSVLLVVLEWLRIPFSFLSFSPQFSSSQAPPATTCLFLLPRLPHICATIQTPLLPTPTRGPLTILPSLSFPPPPFFPAFLFYLFEPHSPRSSCVFCSICTDSPCLDYVRSVTPWLP